MIQLLMKGRSLKPAWRLRVGMGCGLGLRPLKEGPKRNPCEQEGEKKGALRHR